VVSGDAKKQNGSDLLPIARVAFSVTRWPED